MQFIIKQPETADEFEQYYFLRWQILRQPWAQIRGSEKDEFEDSSFHYIALLPPDDSLTEYPGTVIGVSRLQFNTVNNTQNETITTAQIRYMAVLPHCRNEGVATALMGAMEKQVQISEIKKTALDAREPAIGFYQKLGYTLTSKSYLLFDEIQHFKMIKTISKHC